MKRHARGGFSVLEALAALAILAGVLVGGLSYFRIANQRVADVQSRGSIQQIESGAVHDIFSLMQNYFASFRTSGSCSPPPSLAVTLNRTLSSGVAIAPIGSAQANTLATTYASSPAADGIGTILTRCATTHASPGASYYTSHAGIYFCLQFSANDPLLQKNPGFVLSMQPVVGEFYYTNVDALTGAEVNCAPPFTGHPTLGFLYYSFHWVSNLTKTTPLKSVSGFVSLGNG